MYADPDFSQLSTAQRLDVAGALVCGLEAEGKVALTPTQQHLIEAMSRALFGLNVSRAELSPVPPERLAAALVGAEPRLRHRIVQLLVMLELVVDPLPTAVVEAVERYARALHVEEDLLVLARDYASDAYGLALKDLQRKGYFNDWDHHGQVEAKMHVHRRLTTPFELVDHDAQLEGEWKALEACAPGTLGRRIWEFYIGRGFVFPGSVGSVSPTLAQHDWVHVLADYGTVVDSELEVFAFIAAAIPDPRGFSFLAAIIGLFETGHIKEGAGGVLQADPGHLSLPGMPLRVADAMRRGRLCNRDVMYGVDYFELVNLPLEQARSRLDIVEKSPEAIEAGSVGVDEPAGITAYQREHGDPRFQPAAS